MDECDRRWVVDALEDGVASVDDGGRMMQVPAWILPDGTREGDVLAVSRRADGADRATLVVARDAEATAAAFARSREQLTRLAANDPGGDIRL